MKTFKEIIDYLETTAELYYQDVSLQAYRKCLQLLQTKPYYSHEELRNLGIKLRPMVQYNVLKRVGYFERNGRREGHYALVVHLSPEDEQIYTNTLHEIADLYSEFEVKQIKLAAELKELDIQFRNVINQREIQIHEELQPIKRAADAEAATIKETPQEIPKGSTYVSTLYTAARAMRNNVVIDWQQGATKHLNDGAVIYLTTNQLKPAAREHCPAYYPTHYILTTRFLEHLGIDCKRRTAAKKRGTLTSICNGYWAIKKEEVLKNGILS